MRVIADHIRAVTFAISDGLMPGNAKAGYVIRRILRRAIRYGYSYLNLTEPFMTKLVPTLAIQFAEVFPDLNAQRDFVATVIREEEIAFLRTLGTGLVRVDQIISELQASDQTEIPGETVFELNDTFGFPADLTALIAREKGLSIDETGFQKSLSEQKTRSRKDAQASAGDWIELSDANAGSRFVGYDETDTQTSILKYRTVQNKQGRQYQIVLAETPFYAESGGQVGDTGQLILTGPDGQKTIRIVDTKKENDLSVLIADGADLDQVLESATTVSARVDTKRRMEIASNHTATHLLHAALREVLGTHVAQKGSYVGPDSLRFDFSHFSKVDDVQLAEVERIVNTKIREDIRLDEQRNVPIEQAKGMGATALFGEKYGDFVRVITFDPGYSVELCGGTHLPSTGHIGLFKFTSEGSVSTGVRRIEAVTAAGAEQLVNEQMAVVSELKELLKSPKDVVKAVQTLLDERSALQKQIDALQNEKVQQLKNQLLEKVEHVNGHSRIVEKVDVPNADALKQLAYDLKAKIDNLALVLGADINGKPQLAVMLPESLIEGKKMNAGQVVKELAKNIKGGGGGQPFFATAGGSDASGLDAALAQGREILA